MKKSGYLLFMAGIISSSMVLFSGTNVMTNAQDGVGAAPEARADLIIIDNMKSFGPLEKATVEFLHDTHTKALAKNNESCGICHLVAKEQFYPGFKRLKNTSREEVMNIYHDGCIGCHGEMRLKGEQSGPVECDDCHMEKKKYNSSHLAIGFDKSLHARHVQAHENKCDQCHHEYDEKTRTLFYARGKEGTCRYCHTEQTKDNLLSMRVSSHIACINCHINNQAKNPLPPPVKCSQCHDASYQNTIKKLDPIPRLERNQPDMVMITTGEKDLDSGVKIQMSLVPFNHKAHEGYNDTCRVCHHQEMKQCSDCHTLGGSDAAKGLSLELAMHKKDTDRSCVGCHANQYTKNRNCSGCHQFTPTTARMSNRSCQVCHIPIPKGVELTDHTAQLLLEGRPEKPATYTQEEIPEKIIIGKLSKKYASVEFPHRKIINKIAENMGDNKLALHFHAEKATTCSGCHHNAPLTKQPSGCSSCHAKAFNDRDMHKPGIVGAYHLQCMECHTTMKINIVGCKDCHKEKSPQSSALLQREKE